MRNAEPYLGGDPRGIPDRSPPTVWHHPHCRKHAPVKQGTDSIEGKYKVGVGTSLGSLLREGPSFKFHELTSDIIANPCAPSVLDAFVDILAPSLAEAISRNHQRHWGTILPHVRTSLVPIDFSTCGDYSVGIHGILKKLSKLRVQKYRVTFSATEETGPIAREMGILWQQLPMALQDALSYRARPCLEEQVVTRAG